MNARVSTARMLRIADLRMSGTEDADEVRDLAAFAVIFLGSHKWVRSIKQGYLERSAAPMLAVFYFEIEPVDADDSVWIIVGDIPPAYIDTSAAPTGDAALTEYIGAMRHWAETVKRGGDVHGLIPVTYARSKDPLPASTETAVSLEHKMDGIENVLIPWFAEGIWQGER